MFPLPPPRNRNLPVQMGSEIARLAAWWKMIFLAFMFSTIYLRLEGKVASPPGIEIGLNMNAIEKNHFK